MEGNAADYSGGGPPDIELTYDRRRDACTTSPNPKSDQILV